MFLKNCDFSSRKVALGNCDKRVANISSLLFFFKLPLKIREIQHMYTYIVIWLNSPIMPQ